jgi:Non-ribosomal peptide synthetase modules and related proteins
MIQGSDGATAITPDLSGKEEEGNYKESTISLEKPVLEEFCRENGINPSDLFLAATLFALVKFVFTKDILISIISNNSPMVSGNNPQTSDHHKENNSQSNELHKLQELPFYLNIATGKSVQEYLKTVHDSFTQVTSYDYYPFTRVKSEHYILPEFLYNYGTPYREDPLYSQDLYRKDDLKSPRMVVNVSEKEDEFKVTVVYNDALYSDDLSRTFTESMATLVNKLMEPLRVLEDIALLEDPTHEENFHLNPVEEPLLNRLFEKQVDKSRDEVALIAQDGEFTYDELNRKANRIANSLIKRGVNLEDRIMFIMKRDSRLVATMLGIVNGSDVPSYPWTRSTLKKG